MILEANKNCTQGKEIRTADRCREADDWATALNIHPEGSPVVGTMQGVPFQCSYLFKEGGDHAIHFNDKRDTDNKRFTSGEFVRICEIGITSLLYLFTCLLPLHFLYFATLHTIKMFFLISTENSEVVASALAGNWNSTVGSLTIGTDEVEEISFKAQCEDLAGLKVLCKAAFFKVKDEPLKEGIPFDEFYVSAKGIHLTMDDADTGKELLKGSYDAANNTIKWEDNQNEMFKRK